MSLPVCPLKRKSQSNYQEQKNSISLENEASKYIKSLQARLGFARFKMKQGWETSTLFDVEQLWKEKQQKLIKELPKPRFTQRDIIDKRSYIPSAGARHAKAKKAKLTRTYSNPTSSSSGSSKSTLYFHHYNHEKPTISSSASSSSDEGDKSYSNNNNNQPVRNSLDYLSYAIAMTEEKEQQQQQQQQQQLSSQPLPDISEIEPNLIEQEEDLSPPSSPVTSAAKAIMMFVNNSQQQSTFNHNQPYSRQV